MEEMLPGLDKALVNELTADYLLEALICIDFDDLNYVLIRPGPSVAGKLRVSSAADFQSTSEQLLKQLLEKRAIAAPPSGVLVFVRLCPGMHINQVLENLVCLTETLPEATECFFGCFFDPDAKETKIQICLAGKVDF
ncbi:MAG TPA: hypothetical protein VK165_11465 [Azonexus sp.]|nr:hypothetical protein [Azonexus sp.]